METLGPDWLTARVARSTSSTWVPATKRLENFCPMEERSAMARSLWLSDREMKSALSTVRLRGQRRWSYDCVADMERSQEFVSQVGNLRGNGNRCVVIYPENAFSCQIHENKGSALEIPL